MKDNTAIVLADEDSPISISHSWKKFKWKNNVIFLTTFTLLLFPSAIFGGLACLSNPCINGICMDDVNSTYSCYCIDGYTGIQCQTNWDECWSSPCKNGGTCIDGIAEYNCTCPDGYVGLDCGEDFDECESNPCQNNGTCVDSQNEFYCTCLPGYSGTFCETDLAVCNSTEETRCHNGGHCIEGHGISFSCKCSPGWNGKLCEIELDECSSSPCQNGGLCIDSFADYTCACAFGYTGKNCETTIELCSSNPCTNNAICVMEDTIKVCYCVPDYHGEKCQYQYDECLLGPKCMNGGTCIDGVDNFTCSCPPMLTGMLCECLILDDGDYDCEYVSPSTTSENLINTTFVFERTSSASSMHETDYTTIATVDINTSTDSYSTLTQYTTKEDFSKTIVPTLSWDQSTSSVFDNISIDSTIINSFTIESTSSSMLDIDMTSLSATSDSSLGTTVPLITTEEKETTPTFMLTTEYGTSPSIPTYSPFPESTLFENQTIYQITPTEHTIDFKTEFPISSTSPTKTDFENTSSISSTEVSVDGIDITTDFKTYKSTDSIESRSEIEVTSSIASTESAISEVYLTTATDEFTTYVKTDNFSTTSTFTFPIEESTTKASWLFTESPTERDETTTYGIESTGSTDNSVFATVDSLDCSKIECFNGGTCVLSTEGPKCVCKFDFDGSFCENVVGVATAAFSGDSYLTHKLYNSTGIKVQLKARTFSSEGLILYANIGQEIYMCLYVHKGLLKFKFSCGYQTMLLSELEVPINNGYELGIKAILELNHSKRHCNASLHMNDTLAMSGGQITASSPYPSSKDSWLHLGAISEVFGIHHHAPQDIESFTGCMLGLRIDGISRHIFNDASDGFEIKECSSLICLSNPCMNGGTCNDIDEDWTCSCSNGFLGDHCEKSVCTINPCQFGGTCVQHPGSGFLCLCPLGKHGLYCEHNLEVVQPSFSTMVGGLSSFAAYKLPASLASQGMEIRFRIQPNNMDQISLLAFLGQSGLHDPKSDHLAVTFVKGYIMLTWNLGNGPRRIFTSRPINPKNGKSHLIKIGRLGRAAWLAVDNMQNITGNAPGNLLNLDVLPLLYIGGHESVNFSHLPHDLPLHGGFSGCIWDLWIGNIGSKSNGAMWNPVKGRAIGQCSVTQCHLMACHNNGACLHHSATYSCLCTEGWFGPLCTNQHNPCDSNIHKCKHGSTCVPTMMGYQCDCPLGTSGTYCENIVELSDVSLSGIRSYLKLNAVTLGDVHFNLEFEVRPLHPKGIIFYTETIDGCFISISLQGGLLEYRWAGHEWGGKPAGSKIIIIVRSGVVLSLGSWHSIRAGRYGRKLYLWVDGTMTTETLTAHHSFTAFNTSVYIGGVNDLSFLPNEVISGHPIPFTGCIRRVIINSQYFPLNVYNVLESRNINDCDGDICGGDICWNGGTCIISQKHDQHIANCICLSPYTGAHCTEVLPCKPDSCNKGKCIQNTCICPTGWNGHSCQNQIKIDTPQFKGNSYIVIDEKKYRSNEKQVLYTSKMRYKRNVNNIYMNFTTAKSDGLLLWGEMNNQKYVSVGLEGGYLKISWTFPKHSKNQSDLTKHKNDSDYWPIDHYETEIIKILQAGRLSNGDWHSLHFKFQTGNISVTTDGKIVYEENGFSYDNNSPDITMYIGGFPYNTSTFRRTNGLYSTNFIGCISEVSFGNDKNYITDISKFESENVELCQLYF